MNWPRAKWRHTMTRKLQKLTDFDELEEIPMPVNFQGSLRPYQQAGYNWFHFLKNSFWRLFGR
jgi:SNF2 family DNA or RNA helicase